MKIVPAPWSIIPPHTEVLGTDGQPDFLVQAVGDVAVLRRSGVVHGTQGLLILREDDKVMGRALTALFEAFPTSEVISNE